MNFKAKESSHIILSPKLIQFIKENKEIINNEDWGTLTKKSSILSFSDEVNLYYILNQVLAKEEQP